MEAYKELEYLRTFKLNPIRKIGEKCLTDNNCKVKTECCKEAGSICQKKDICDRYKMTEEERIDKLIDKHRA